MIHSPRKRWTPREQLAGLTPTQVIQRAELLAQDLSLDPLVARLLVLRSHDTAPAAQQFLNGNLATLPSPHLLKGMDKACRRLLSAIHRKEPILIMTDYDQDGQASAAIFYEFFKTVGAVVDFFIPHRERDDYGLSAEAIRQAAARGVKVVLSGDCGISNHQEALLCKELEIDLVVTDQNSTDVAGGLRYRQPAPTWLRFPRQASLRRRGGLLPDNCHEKTAS